ncbi:uncharacterized protein LOC119125999 [Syngnathus acus]|uniref:uncharacterized protein LOC119125999 n=1 Tax=Syngnathus acus TaxID=161584 RepID=UPI001886130D|nr:uncharacterized protein LOC119125999 [Syngnathus acus]
MDVRSLVGKCLPLLFAGLALDAAGLTLLLVGVFANVRSADDQFYGDFFIFTGAVIIFASLGFWVMWYAGNVRVPPGDARDGRAKGLAARIVRKLSERLSRKMASAKAGAIASTAGNARVHDDDDLAGRSRPHQASRITWGKATVHNSKQTEPQNDNNFGRYRQENNNQDEKGYDNQGFNHETDHNEDKYSKGFHEDYHKEENYNYTVEGYDTKEVNVDANFDKNKSYNLEGQSRQQQVSVATGNY